MTFARDKQWSFIRSELYAYIEKETVSRKLYNGIREIIRKCDDAWEQPEDWEIKNIQRLTDAKYIELGGLA